MGVSFYGDRSNQAAHLHFMSASRILGLIDDVVPPWKPRGIEIRGHAQAIPEGGQALSPHYSPELIRLTPTRIIFWDLTSDSRIHTARNVEKGEG